MEVERKDDAVELTVAGKYRTMTVRWRRLDGSEWEHAISWGPKDKLPLRIGHVAFFGTDEPVELVAKDGTTTTKGRSDTLELPHTVTRTYPGGEEEIEETPVLVIGP